MRLIVCKNYDEISKKASELVKNIMLENPNPIFGFATGSSPIGMYENLIEMNKKGEIDFSNAVSVNLDEYMDIDEDNPQSYHYFMHDNLFSHINIKKENVHIPSASSDTFEEDIKKYNEVLDSVGTRDVQILGIGRNGHIAFNEPNDKLNLRTNIVDLKKSTIEANSRFFEKEEDVPTKAISMGLEDIFNSKMIILLASGAKKHDAIQNLINSPYLDLQNPSTTLHLHNNFVLIVDEDAYNG